MNTKTVKTSSPKTPAPAGLPVRSDLRAGAWRCNNCQGNVMGNQLFKPDCGYCQKA